MFKEIHTRYKETAAKIQDDSDAEEAMNTLNAMWSYKLLNKTRMCDLTVIAELRLNISDVQTQYKRIQGM